MIVRKLIRSVFPKAGKRDHRLELLKSLPLGGRCVEIGVWKGDFSQQILDVKQPDELHLVDPWVFRPEFPRRMYGGKKAGSQIDMDRIAASVESRFRNRPEVRVHRLDSTAYFSRHSDSDWVYIDGDHSEEAVYSDLLAAWRALQAGGVVSGDDVTWRDADGSLPVQRALSRFAQEAGIRPRIIGSQFSITKPETF